MKITKSIASIVLLLLVFSCSSDELSNSKAKKIISKCLEKEPEQRTVNIRIGEATFYDRNDKELLNKYMKLKEQGMIEMKLLKKTEKGWNKRKEFSVKLTEKALKFIDEVPENGNYAQAKIFKYIVDDVLEVHETPAINEAVVRVKYKTVDITPFNILSNIDPKEFRIEKLKFTKISNGWKYCDEF